MAKLSDTQSILLARSAQRGDGSLYPLPPSLEGKGAAVTKALAALIKQGLAAESETSARDAAYRSDGDLHFAVVITAAWLAAIGIVDEAEQVGAASETPATAAPALPRATKPAAVLALLGRGEGATLLEIITATA